MTSPTDDAALLVAELLARRWLPRTHPRVKRALINAELWDEIARRLADVGLRLVDSVHADHVCLTLLRSSESTVFGDAGLGANNNIDLPRDGVALLIVLWSLIVLPKRERQAARVEPHGDGQSEFFASDKPLPSALTTAPRLSYRTLLADFGDQLGRKIRIDSNLKLLERQGFIVRRGDEIAEGPLLDLLLDHDILAPRILDGALGDVLARERVAADAAALVHSRTDSTADRTSDDHIVALPTDHDD
ncbi:MAG: hypothetical protein RJA98_4019 [Pseudomonadota bacterium]|jgi:hypothetical protein